MKRTDLEKANLYMYATISVGGTALLFTLSRLKAADMRLDYCLFAVVTLLFASRIVVRIPGVKGHISVSDTFIFLSLLLFGGELGVLLSAADAVVSGYKLSKTRLTYLFNISVFVIATFTTTWITRLLLGPVMGLASTVDASNYISAVCLMALTQYVVNSGLIAVGVGLRTGNPVWRTWKDNFLWTSLTYFAGASAAGLIGKLVPMIGIFAFLGAAPIVAVVYFTYTTYLKNVEAASEKAELAQKHIEELSHHISEQERISRALKESEQYFRKAFDHAAGMAVISPEGKWLQVNESLCSMLGYTEEELLANGFQAVTHPNDLGNDLGNLYRLLGGNIPNYQLEKRYCHKTGHTIWVLQSASLIRDEDGTPRHVIFQIQDISDRKKAEELIHHAAFHDALTGLPNRVMFSDRLSMAVERSKRTENYHFAVIFVDLDRFKVVNDSLGHDMGDKLLIELSRRLESCLREVDTVARLGGDEFAILLDGIDALDCAIEVAERIQSALQRPFDLDGHNFFSSASLGIAFSGEGYERPEDMLRDADTAMYKAKANGKGRHEIFNCNMHTHAVEILTLENELRCGLDRDEIKPYFQPIVELNSGKIVGFEALARWLHPKRGLVSPADFIPLAEETGLVLPLGLTIMRQACHQVRQWQLETGRRDLSISVNISGKQLKGPNPVQEIKEILFETGLHPHHLRVEITETIVMDNTAETVEFLKQLKGIGVKILLDDFGTGYSSLSYLHRYPFDVIKIDRSFVNRMMVDRESLGIVKTIAALANELDKSVICEGVENVEQLQTLTRLNCGYAQGYLFSKPLNAISMGEILKTNLEYTPAMLPDVSFVDPPLGRGLYEM